MSVLQALDIGLSALVLAVAVWTIAAREALAAVVGFVAYGLLLSLVWVRLFAVDVALTEAAIGGGVTGVLLIGAAARLRDAGNAEAAEQPNEPQRFWAGALCVLVTAALAAVVLLLPDPAPTLAPEAAQNLAETGLGNPITAVLIAYRSFDTMLEKVVLVLAALGVWSLAPDRYWGVPLGHPARRGRNARWLSSRNCCRRSESSSAFTSSGPARMSQAAPFRVAPFSPPCG
jgi:multisubunit Na+/H+ antiporter MnhB subunit